MSKKVLSIVIALSMIMCTLPAYAKAEGTTGMPTLILTEALVLAEEAAGNESEGWQWIPDSTGGGTLILENCYIQSEIYDSIIYFNNLTEENCKINIVLRGHNTIEIKKNQSGSVVTTNMLDINGTKNSVPDYIISEDGEGSLDIVYGLPSDLLYMFSGRSVTIKSGDISTNSGFCIIKESFSVLGGSLKINVPEEVANVDGIYTINGPVNINGGKVDINVSRCGIFVSGDPSQNQGNQTVNISGGDVNIKSGFSCIHIEKTDLPGEDTQTINITGGNVACNGELTGLYAKNVSIVKGEGTGSPVVNISKGEGSTYPSIIPLAGKITVYGSIVTADGIAGYNSPDSLLEDSMVFNGSDGNVYGNVEITDNFAVPDGAVLSIPDGATVSVPEDTVLSVPDSASLQVSGSGQVVNNGTVILPENNAPINSTGTGIIKKGDSFYTNDSEQIYPVTVKQNGNEFIEYYKEGETVTLVPGAGTDEIKFKEWKTTPDTLVITDHQFVMPAEAVTAEAVFGHMYKVTVKQPGGIVTEYHMEGESVTLVPEVLEGKKFKEWKTTPDTLVITDNQFIMPLGEVMAEPVYEEIPAVTDSPVPTGTPGQTGTPDPAETPLPPAETPSPSPSATSKPYGVNLLPYIHVKNVITTVLAASPAEGGRVSGNREAMEGETITVKAVANDGYVFAEWQEDGKKASTEAEYTFKAEKNRTLTAVFKKTMPGNIVQNTIHVANNIKTVSFVPLPSGWEWRSQDSAKTIPAGGSVAATAVYTAGDAKYYINTELKVTVTRDICKENQTVLYTREGEYAPGCTTDGTGHTECSICGDTIRDGVKTPAAGHKAGAPVVKKASLNKDGSIDTKCVSCNSILNSTKINAIKTIKLNKKYEIFGTKNINIYSYIEVKDSEGNLLNSESDYTVSPVGPDIGIYTVKITFKGEKYGGTAELPKKFKIIPQTPKLMSCRGLTKKIRLRVKCPAKTTGYQVQYSTNKKFTKQLIEKTTYKIKKNSSPSYKTVKCRKSKKMYYIRVRAYEEVKNNGKKRKVYSEWSKTKRVKVR